MNPACAGSPVDLNGHIRGFGLGAPQVGEGLHLFVDLPVASTRTVVRGLRGGSMHMVSAFFADTVQAKAWQTSTMTSIILVSSCGDRETT